MTGTTAQQDDGKVNINTADENELMTIPGIGPSKAAAIIQYRDGTWAFQNTRITDGSIRNWSENV